jgi:hypothetical protein
MKCLVFSHVALWAAHHAETVEMALNEYNAGNEVIFLSCTGALATCPANPFKKEALCKTCRKQTEYTKSKILPKEIIKIDLKFETNEERRISRISSIEDLRKIELNGFPIGMLVYSTYATNLYDSFFITKNHINQLNILINNSIELYQYGLYFIKTNVVEKLYIWNGRRSCEGPLIYAAKELGVSYSTFISGGKYNSILIRENAGVHDIEASKKDLSISIFNLKNNCNRYEIVNDGLKYFDYMGNKNDFKSINKTNTYQFSKTFDKQNSLELTNCGKKLIGVFVGTYTEFAGLTDYDIHGSWCNNFYEGVEYLQNNLCELPNHKIVVRWHPNSRHLKENEYKRMNKVIQDGLHINGITHIPSESRFNTYELIDACDISLCFGTSVAIESCLYGKPTIFIGHNMFEDLECFYKPTSYQDMVQALKSDVPIGNFDHALVWGYYFSNFGNYLYKFLKQRSKENFFYENKRLLVSDIYYRRLLGEIKQTIFGSIKSLLNLTSKIIK